MRLLTELAWQDYKQTFDKMIETKRSVRLPPLSQYLHYHLRLFELLEKGKLDEKHIKSIMQENREFAEAIEEVSGNKSADVEKIVD